MSRYADVVAVARNPQDFSSAKGIGPAVVDDTRNMIELDPPDHTRLRRLVQKAFTPRSIALWEDRIRDMCNELIDQLVDARQCDFMTEFATPLPVRIIAEMLGVEPERMDDFKRWSDAVVDALVADPKTLDKETFVATLREMNAYFRTIVETRRAEPRDDLTTALVQVREERDALSDAEILGSMLLLLVAGNELTTNLIGNGTVAITADEEQRGVADGQTSHYFLLTGNRMLPIQKAHSATTHTTAKGFRPLTGPVPREVPLAERPRRLLADVHRNVRPVSRDT